VRKRNSWWESCNWRVLRRCWKKFYLSISESMKLLVFRVMSCLVFFFNESSMIKIHHSFSFYTKIIKLNFIATIFSVQLIKTNQV
jgi:hypothetical protein